VILAAGPSARFESDLPKQLVEFRGEPLVRRVTRRVLSSRLRQILVVVGHRGPALAAVMAGLAIELIDNCAFRSGQSSSVKCALPHIDPAAEAALFIPGDQPFVDPHLLDSLVDTFERTGAPIVLPKCGERRGSPVLIGRSLFRELAEIEGDAGGRQLFDQHESEIVEVAVTNELSLRDIDTWSDYQELLAIAESGSTPT
jgi:molybdenum cofactor cytidylyltransferase